jgi:hypothetical protein
VYSCSNKCTEKTTHTVFSSFKQPAVSDCYCDKACNDVFEDCCSNYEQSCSMKLTYIDDFYKQKSNWRCVIMKVNTGKCARPKGSWI